MGPGIGTRATSQTPTPTPPVPPLTHALSEPRRFSTRVTNKIIPPNEREKARTEAVKEIASVQDAIAKLESRQFSVPDQEYTNTHLASILFQLTATLPAEGASIVKAVAILVNQLDLDNHADRMAIALMDTLEHPMEGFVRMGTSIQTHTDRIIEGHESIENCVLEMVARVSDLHEAFCDTQEKTEANTLAVQNLTTNIEGRPAPPGTGATASPPQLANPNSYAARTSAHLPVVHNKVMARNEERQRQVLFTTTQGMTSQSLDDQDPQILITKANLALTAMKATHDDIPNGIQFMSAKTLAKGDILFDMDSPESAEWIRKDGIRLGFMQGFGAMSEIKDREHTCVVENMPVGFRPSTESTLEVEITNSLSPKAIMLAQWIKPIEHRFEGQRTAFMILTFRTAEDANKAIHNSLYIHGKRCITRKLLPKPQRCFKCHAINAQHIAASCKEITDICSTCGGAHISKDCQLKNDHPDKHYCTNCRTHGHSARDRLCPVYIKKCNELYNRKPEFLYKYFPTDNPNTWELLHPASNPPPPTTPPQEGEDQGWSAVTNKRKKQYNYPRPQSQNQNQTVPLTPQHTHNAKTTSSNAIPLGRPQQQRFLDDMGMAGPSRPGPTQQYRTPSQQQKADKYRATQSMPVRSAFSPLSTSLRPPPTQESPRPTPYD